MLEAATHNFLLPVIPTSASARLAFGPFLLVPGERLLLREGLPARIGGRAFDLLVALACHAGMLMTPAQLFTLVWGKTLVEESSLRVQLSLLRKVLGQRQGGRPYIATLAGKGYCFVAPLSRFVGEDGYETPAGRNAVDRNGDAAAHLSLVGREDELATLMTLAPRQKLLTLTGPAGVGKSALGVAVGRRTAALFRDGVVFLDVSSMESCGHLRACADAAIAGRAAPVLPRSDACPARRLLVVLDNCDHHTGCISAFIEGLRAAHDDVHVIVTSRRPLQVNGEYAIGISSLSRPAPGLALSALEAIGFDAVQLFVQVATGMAEDFRLDERNVGLVVSTCSRLEGLPGAIKDAAIICVRPRTPLPMREDQACPFDATAPGANAWHGACLGGSVAA